MLFISGISSKLGYLSFIRLVMELMFSKYLLQIGALDPPFTAAEGSGLFFKHLQNPRFDRHNFGRL